MAKKKVSAREQRHIRTQQVILAVIGILVILSMVLALVVNY